MWRPEQEANKNMGLHFSAGACPQSPSQRSPRWPSVLFLGDLTHFVPATQLWVTNFCMSYLEEIIKWFSPQALPTGCCYFKLKKKTHKKKHQKTRKETKSPTCGKEENANDSESLPGCSQPTPGRATCWSHLGPWQFLEVAVM